MEDVTPECVNRIGRVDDYAALFQYFYDVIDFSQFRVIRIDSEKHDRQVVGEKCRRYSGIGTIPKP